MGAGDDPRSLAAFLARNPECSLCAIADGKPVGALLAGEDGRRGCFYHLWVRTDFRRGGIATDLLERASRRLRDRGVERVQVHILVENEEAKAFWRRRGFTPMTHAETWAANVAEISFEGPPRDRGTQTA